MKDNHKRDWWPGFRVAMWKGKDLKRDPGREELALLLDDSDRKEFAKEIANELNDVQKRLTEQA